MSFPVSRSTLPQNLVKPSFHLLSEARSSPNRAQYFPQTDREYLCPAHSLPAREADPPMQYSRSLHAILRGRDGTPNSARFQVSKRNLPAGRRKLDLPPHHLARQISMPVVDILNDAPRQAHQKNLPRYREGGRGRRCRAAGLGGGIKCAGR